MLGTFVAIVALGWAMYAYFFPRPAGEAAVPPNPAASVNVSAPPSAGGPPTSSAPAAGAVTEWVSGIATFVRSAATKLHARYERDRHDRSGWALLLIWFLWSGVALWTLWEDMPVLLVPMLVMAYIQYYGPSLSAWGTSVSVVGGIVVTLLAVVVWLERRV